ncbi:hypothetical protein KAR91_81070, partial [Candidatus Pacearchaeota archaeon]|nr:hypothetical protein [Candidatus Pacearchaeota archaeon]
MEEHTKLKEWKGEGGGNIDYMRHEINYILAIFRSSYDFLKSEMGRLGLSFGRDGVDASNDIEEAIERLQKFTKNISIEGILQKIKDFDAGNGVGLEEKEAESEVLLRKKIDTLSFFFHEINNSLAVLDSNHFFLEGEISRLNLDLREDGKASLGDMGTAIRELKTFVGSRNGVQPKSDHKEGSLNSEEAAPEKIKDRMVFLIDDDERIMKALRRVIKGEFQ